MAEVLEIVGGKYGGLLVAVGRGNRRRWRPWRWEVLDQSWHWNARLVADGRAWTRRRAERRGRAALRRAEPLRLCAQCQLSAGVDRPVGDPECPHKGQGWYQ